MTEGKVSANILGKEKKKFSHSFTGWVMSSYQLLNKITWFKQPSDVCLINKNFMNYFQEAVSKWLNQEKLGHSGQSKEICMKAARDLLVTLLNMWIQYKMFCKHASKIQDTKEYSNILQLLYLTSTKPDTAVLLNHP